MYVSTRKLRRKIRKARRIFYPLFTQYSRVSAISVRNKHCTIGPYCDARKGKWRKRERKPARDASHTYEITRYFCHPSPRPANVSTHLATRKREGWTGSRARSWLRMRAWVSTGGWRGAAKGGRGWNRVGGGRAGGRTGEEAGCLAWEAFISPEVLNTKRGRELRKKPPPARLSTLPVTDWLKI